MAKVLWPLCNALPMPTPPLRRPPQLVSSSPALAAPQFQDASNPCALSPRKWADPCTQRTSILSHRPHSLTCPLTLARPLLVPCLCSVSFQVGDALQQPFADGQFDLVWSLESGEHMPDKAQFVGELARVCAPGGRVIVVTWCHRCAQSYGERVLHAGIAAVIREGSQGLEGSMLRMAGEH